MGPINFCPKHFEKGNIGSLLLRKFLLVTTVAILVIISFPFGKSVYDQFFQNDAHSVAKKAQSDGLSRPMLLPEFVLIPAGSFDMGEQEADFIKNLDAGEKKYFGIPGKRVRINEPFYLSKTEITNEQFASYVQAQQLNGQLRENAVTVSQSNNEESYPVVEVSWRRAMAYAAWLGKQTQRSCRLPTEAEWEYAARGGRNTAYPWGDVVGINKANCDGCGNQASRRQALPVGQFQANAYGLFDMSGNVWEWTCSLWGDQYDGQEQQCADMEDFNARVVRGGSWGYSPKYVRSAARGEFDPDIRYNGFGFRVMCSSSVE